MPPSGMEMKPLAPAGGLVVSQHRPTSQPITGPTSRAWADALPQIRHMYIVERRKLRYVISHMEAKYGFRATPQMYKKQFAKFEFRKNSRREEEASMSSTATGTIGMARRSHRSRNATSIPGSPSCNSTDAQMLSFLTNVQNLGTSFYDKIDFRQNQFLAPPAAAAAAKSRRLCPEHSQGYEINFLLKLVIDMLDQGHGKLAGRAVRKAFLLIEGMLMLHTPALLWNMLEIMHYILVKHHFRLFRLLLRHTSALASIRMPPCHSLIAMLQSLQAFDMRGTDCRSHGGDVKMFTPLSRDPIRHGMLLSMIERAWTLNAQNLFQRFDQRLFQLYIRVHWDSCSIAPPPAIFDATRKCLLQISSQQNISARRFGAEDGNATMGLIPITPFEEDDSLQRVFASLEAESVPINFESLRDSSISALRIRAGTILSKSEGSSVNSTAMLRILAGLLTAKVIQDDALSAGSEVSCTSDETSCPSNLIRGQVEHVVCALRISLEHESGARPIEFESNLEKISRYQSIIRLRQCTGDASEPRVIREMWLLQQAMMAAGKHAEALTVNQAAHERLEEHIRDVPGGFM